MTTKEQRRRKIKAILADSNNRYNGQQATFYEQLGE